MPESQRTRSLCLVQHGEAVAESVDPRRPLSVSAVSLIWRDEPPDDVFRVAEMVPLASGRPG